MTGNNAYTALFLAAIMIATLLALSSAGKSTPPTTTPSPAPPPPPPGTLQCPHTDPATGLLFNSAKNFAIFAGAGYTFAGGLKSTVINGDIAAYPTLTPLNSNPMVTLNGIEQTNATQNAIVSGNIGQMYNNAMGRTPRALVSGDVGGRTLYSGIYYSSSTLGVTGALTLDAQGNSSAIFLIIAQSALLFSPYSTVVLKNGATACRVFWVAGSSVTINNNCIIIGELNVYASITVGYQSNITGHLFAGQTVTINTNVVSIPTTCTYSTASLQTCSEPAPVAIVGEDTSSSIVVIPAIAMIAAAMVGITLSN